MTGEQRGALVTMIVVGLCYGSLLVAMFRYAGRRTPAGIVRRLYRTGQPVTVAVNLLNAETWDPSRSLGIAGFVAHGKATYTLDDPSTVRVLFRPPSGAVVERSGQIPASLLPDTPETHRRRVIARLVIAVYLLMGVATFVVTAVLVDGTPSRRLRIGALSALAGVAVSWLITHLVLTRPHRKQPRPVSAPSRHLLAWLVGFIAAAAALGVAWHVGNLDQPHPMSWAGSFLSSAIFVLVSGAALSASLHHHTYLHHRNGSHGK